MTDRVGAFGKIDKNALTTVKNTFERVEPLVTSAEYDDPLNPQRLSVRVSAGFTRDDARFDVRWSVHDWYSVHYIEGEAFNCRFDRHRNSHSPEKHFHPPPRPADNEAVVSCIEVESVELVIRAVCSLWRDALAAADPALLNRGDNPP